MQLAAQKVRTSSRVSTREAWLHFYGVDKGRLGANLSHTDLMTFKRIQVCMCICKYIHKRVFNSVNFNSIVYLS